ncbi:hypothetical protein C8J57DRAFT_1080252 [Mycena rebaudengoi]|nr:hypothetical protein C8J57DRAFT_1080252 [Mycena rebaudengoi]
MDYTSHRPPTPDSPLTNRDSLYDATTTIDDLTQALENVSRVASPEPPALFFCCCGREDCENVQAWLGMKTRLESRLTLSAEVGQALLQRHEAYVRRHEAEQRARREASYQESDDGAAAAATAQEHLDELTKENKALEKRLTQALVNNEVTEVSNKTILQELAEAKTTISRLTTSHARSVGWDTRLSAAMKEKDDMQQERDGESQRARVAESRFAALKERTSKLQSDVRRLQSALEEQREHRLESSESILVDARARLQTLNRSIGAPLEEQPELTSVLETLVDDNETLKRDNAELQQLLADAREDCRALQEEVEDQRVNPGPVSRGAENRFLIYLQTYGFKRSSSTERRASRRYEPLTPETNRRPLSPADSLFETTKWASFPQHAPSPSRMSFELDEGQESLTSPNAYPHSGGGSHSPSSAASVYSDSLAPSTAPSANNHAGNPTTAATGSTSLSALIERAQALLQRMQSADALSLTNRLKRQQIRGADVRHLSQSTVAGILADVGRQLRATGASVAPTAHLDATITATTTTTATEEVRKRDVRALAGVLREMFGAMGEMRVVLNEVVLDPGCAGRVSEAAMDPGKAAAASKGAEGSSGGGWMAPLSKLAGGGGGGHGGPTLAAPRPMMPPPRFVPKLGPALSASATTVNVEFSGSGLGRAMTSTSTFAAPEIPSTTTSNANPGGGTDERGRRSVPPAPSSVMGIFAGAPQRTKTPDPWIVIPNPKLPRRVPAGGLLRPNHGSRHHANRMSRNVEAVLDGGADEAPDYLGPLMERRLRRRGLSDSSIHSTYASQAPPTEDDVQTPPPSAGLTRREAAWLESGSVLQALGRRVQSFRASVGGSAALADMMSTSGSEGGASVLSTSPSAHAPAPIAVPSSRRSSRASSKGHNIAGHPPLKNSASTTFSFLPSLANLVPTGEAAEMARSLRDQDSMASRTFRQTGERGVM